MRPQFPTFTVKPTVLLKLFMIAGVTVAALTGCGRGPAPASSSAGPALQVKTARAILATEPRFESVAGTVHSLARAQVSTKITGRIAQAEFVLGQTIAVGEPLVMLAADELNARVDQAQAALDQAENDHTREATLLSKGAATTDSVRSLAERRRMAGAALAEAKAMLGYTRVTAPFNGVITRKFVNAGDLASAGTPLFELEGIDQLRAEVEVPESLATIALGASLTMLTGERRITGTLAEFSPASDPLSRTRLAKVSLPDNVSVHQGQFIRVFWPAGENALLTVPTNAIGTFGQMEQVFVVKDGKAVLRLVKTGLHDGSRVQILAGLDANETVILDAPASLHDGQAVTFQP